MQHVSGHVMNRIMLRQAAARVAPYHGKHIDDGDLAEEVFAGIVENAAHRIVRTRPMMRSIP